MTIATPQYSTSASYGGVLDKIFQNLPIPFNPDPKPQVALTFTQTPTPRFPYISVKDGILYLHSKPLDTIAYTPEISYDLTQHSVSDLAGLLSSNTTGYTVTASIGIDGKTSALLLGFTNYQPAAGETTQLQIATSRLWIYLHPIASAMKEAEDDATNGENMMYVSYAQGFWLDFWGDWLNIPRQPGMTDMQYVLYMLWNFRVPKVNNMAIEDILMSKYKVPIKVTDSGLYQFTVSLDPSLMNTVTQSEIAPLVNQIKAAGIQWLMEYIGNYSEDFQPYFSDRHNGALFAESDQMALQLSMSENARTTNTTNPFMLNSSLLNSSTYLGYSPAVREEKIVMYYNSPSDPSYTVM